MKEKVKVHIRNRNKSRQQRRSIKALFEHLCLKLVRDTEGNNKAFYKYGSNKWNFNEQEELANGAENLVTDYMEQTETFNSFSFFCVSDFTGKANRSILRG